MLLARVGLRSIVSIPARNMHTTTARLLRSTPDQQPDANETPRQPSHITSIYRWAYASNYDDKRGGRERSVVFRSSGYEPSEGEGEWQCSVEVKDSSDGEDFEVKGSGPTFEKAKEGESALATRLRPAQPDLAPTQTLLRKLASCSVIMTRKQIGLRMLKASPKVTSDCSSV